MEFEINYKQGSDPGGFFFRIRPLIKKTRNRIWIRDTDYTSSTLAKTNKVSDTKNPAKGLPSDKKLE